MSDIHLSGFLFNASGAAVSGATVEAFAKNTVTETGGTPVTGGSTTTNSSGYYTMTVTSDNELDVRITSGNSVRWRRFDDRLQIEEVEVSVLNIREGATAQVYTIAPGSISADRTLTLPAATGNDTLASIGLAQTFSAAQTYSAGIVSTASANTLGATSFNDAAITNVGDIALDSISADGTDINVAVSDNSATALTIKQGSDAYLIIDTANSSESVSIGTGISGTAITLGHSTSEVTVADNLTVTGNLTVSGTQTTVDSTTINATNAFVFEGATADAHETTLGIVDPTADATINLPAMSAGTYYLPVMSAVSTTAVSSTPAELNLLDGSSANTVVNSKAVIYGSGGEVAGTLSTAAQTAITSLGTLTALTVDDVAVNGKVITMTGSTGDTAVFTVGTGGTLSLVTTDAAGTDADLTIDADGQINIDANDAAGIFLGINGTNQINLVDGVLKPVTDNDVDLGVSGGPEFKNGYFNGTLEADAVTIGGTNVVSGSLITTLGTVSAGTWEGTTIAVAQGGTGATSLTDKAVLISQDSGTDTVGSVALTTDGQIIIGGSSGPAAATLTAGDGIDITNGDGSIEIIAETASTTNPGAVELATAAETTTGTDTGRAVTPDGLAGSVVFGTRYAQMVVFDFTTDIAEGNGKFYFHVPAGLNGMDLVEVHAKVITVGSGSTVDVQIHNLTDGSDMLSTSLTIDNGELDSKDAATAAVINGSEDDVVTNDVLRIDVDGNGGDTTIAKGLIVTLGFRLP